MIGRIEDTTSEAAIPDAAAAASNSSPAKKLPLGFYARPVLTVARECIGKVLVHRTPEGETAGRIVEAEAYRGPEDRAAHSWRGMTPRTAVMFGPPGRAYVYLLYGVSWAFNIVTTAEGLPHAVLIRALEPIRGIELMAVRRRQLASARELTNGPGKLTQAMSINRADYARDLCGDELFLEAGVAGQIGRSARINVERAGEPWASRPWRFYERGSQFVSGPRIK